MEIKTKYNPGNKVWVMLNNKPDCREISDMKIEVYKPGTNANNMHAEFTIWYNMCGFIGSRWLEKDIFLTKQELINSL